MPSRLLPRSSKTSKAAKPNKPAKPSKFELIARKFELVAKEAEKRGAKFLTLDEINAELGRRP